MQARGRDRSFVPRNPDIEKQFVEFYDRCRRILDAIPVAKNEIMEMCGCISRTPKGLTDPIVTPAFSFSWRQREFARLTSPFQNGGQLRAVLVLFSESNDLGSGRGRRYLVHARDDIIVAGLLALLRDLAVRLFEAGGKDFRAALRLMHEIDTCGIKPR